MIRHIPEIGLHVLFWLFSLWMLNQNFVFETQDIFFIDGQRHEVKSRNTQVLTVVMFTLVGKMVLTYGNACWAMPRFLKNRNAIAFSARLLVLILSAVLVEVIAVLLIARHNPDVSLKGWTALWQLHGLLYLLYFGISIAYVTGKKWHQQERDRQQLEREKMTAELNFLKSQINPHFLFNTLNNLYALANRHQHDDLAQGIAGLSDLMRYMLYDCRADQVSLEKEVTFIEALIEIQQLRLDTDDTVAISFTVTGELANRYIAPMILLPFVENAFKHGIRWKASSFVKIDLDVQPDAIHFTVVNSRFADNELKIRESSGIGLENVRRRLDLLYPEQHTIAVMDDTTAYTVKLMIADRINAVT